MTKAGSKAKLQRLLARARDRRAAQDLEGAHGSIELAAKFAPDDPAIAFMRAQIAFESWRPAADLFARALELAPGQADVLRNYALALAAEGEGAAAQRLLTRAVGGTPGWVDGHNMLATLRTTSGDEDFGRSFVDAIKAEPGNPALRLAHFHKLAAAKRWDSAQAVLDNAEQAFPGERGVKMARAFLSSEGEKTASVDDPFAEFSELADPGTDIARIRWALRQDKYDLAGNIAESHLAGPQASLFWPYCSLVWRMTGDPRAQWLGGQPSFDQAVDLAFAPGELDDLASVLRSLHHMQAPYPEQSVRGGTQTERNLLLHHDPVISALRSKITAAVTDYREALPPDEPNHPLLGRKPADIRIAGSWSVRLKGQGFHSAHTHPRGWLSSALYIAVPDKLAADHAGQLALGLPPPELGLPLAPTGFVAPKPGRLVLFPSYFWHATVPFGDGERLTVAFDIAPRNQAS